MARTKEVYDSSVLPRLWADQTIPYGRNKQKNMTFQGVLFYSYTTVIARLILKNGIPSAALHSTRSWSVTTNKQQNALRSATCNLKSFRVADVQSDDHKSQIKDYEERIEESRLLVVRARIGKRWRLATYEALVDEANEYCEYFNLSKRFTHQIDVGEERYKATKYINQRQENVEKKAKEKKRKAIEEYPAKLAQYKIDLDKWRVGATDQFPGSKPPRNPEKEFTYRWCEPTIILLRLNDGVVESSSDEKIETDELMKLLPYVRSPHIDKEPAITVGEYGSPTFDYHEQTVTFDTHRPGGALIPLDEIDRIAKLLNL